MWTWWKAQKLARRLANADGESRDRIAAAEELGKLGDYSAVGELLRAIQNDDVGVAIAATRALKQIADPRGLDLMLARMRTADVDFAQELLATMRACDETETIRLFIDLFVNGDRLSIDFARPYLKQLGPAAIGQARPLLDTHPSQAIHLLDLLGWVGESLKQKVALAIAKGRYSDAIALGEEGIAAVVEQFRRGGHKEIGEALAQSGDIEPLLRITGAHSYGDVYSVAVKAISKVRNPKVVPLLVSALLSTHDERFRETLFETLHAIGDAGLLALIDLLRNPDERIRDAAASILSRPNTGERAADSQVIDSNTRRLLISINFKRWSARDDARIWVHNHEARWNHDDWLSLLDRLRGTNFWPMEEAEIGQTVEALKKGYYQNLVKRAAQAAWSAEQNTRLANSYQELRRSIDDVPNEYGRLADRYESMSDSLERDHVRQQMRDLDRLPDQLRMAGQAKQNLQSSYSGLSASQSLCCRPDMFDTLIESLTNSDVMIQATAAEVLGPLGDRRAIEALKVAANSPYPRVQDAARDSLKALGVTS